jgi:DnaK suppressor protein
MQYDRDMEPSADPTDPAIAGARLEAERASLRAELGEEIEAPGQVTYGSQAAAAAQVFAQQRDLAFREQAERRLRAVEHAIARLRAGLYGTCEGCGRTIPPERLDLVPWATTCVTCHAAAAR